MRFVNPEHTVIQRNDGTFVPVDPTNTDYQNILKSGVSIAPFTRFSTLDEAKLARLGDLSTRRAVAEQTFVFAGQPIRLDESTQSRISGALQYLTLSGQPSIQWQARRGVFVTLTKAQIEALATAAGAHVQACFTNAKTLTDLINAASTFQEVEAVNLEVGWP